MGTSPEHTLQAALLAGDLKAATRELTRFRLFGSKPDLNRVRLQNVHPLIYWIEMRAVDAVTWALAHGADPNVINDQRLSIHGGRVFQGFTALQVALGHCQMA